MAKRNIRKTDSDTTSTPESRHASPVEPNGRAAAPKTARSRRKSDTATPASQTAGVSPVTAEGVIEETRAEAAATVAPSFTTVAEVAAVQLSHDQIAERAYHLYLERGRQPGDPFADWLMAERELRKRFVGA